MITVDHLSKAYVSQVLLDEVGFTVTPGQRVGLIGRNGCGKTTLLKILTGEVESDGGTVTPGPGVTMGYLGQEGQLSPDRTLYQEMLDVFSETFRMEADLRAMEQSMAELSGDDLTTCMSRYADLQSAFEHAEGHLIDGRIRSVLAGLGFRPQDVDRPCREFSGGWQMRGAMARLLLRAPNVLLLDEPTNHLDVGAVEWLEQYLAEYKGLVVLVSHDRYFLDRAVNRVLELENGKITEYAGNYSFYLEEKERREEQQAALYQTQQKKLEHDQRFIERFRYKATLATRVKSREKMLDRMEKVEAPKGRASAMRVRFAPSSNSGRLTLVVKGLRKAYGSLQVLKGIDLKIEREERIALLGRNGAGKSTLLRLLAEEEAPDAGTISPGFRLTPVYYAQHQAETLNPDRTVLEELEAVAPPGMEQTELRTILGCFLFTGDSVQKKVGVLSGGEKSRVALARCVVRPSNLLLLDEPTNHLDISAREELLGALQLYEGTIVFISHDRSFMDGLCTSVVDMNEGIAERHLGTYSEFRERRAAEEKRKLQLQAALAAQEQKARRQAARHAPKPVRGPQTVRWTVEALEKKIFSLEEQIVELAGRLADPEVHRDPQVSARTTREYEALVAECATLTATWEEMA
ncbi:MAG TPA: ABC-F family ATP-binding cassette domain-containing protein [Candidatus Xenobia bacterium]